MVKSRKTARDYIVLKDDERFPVKVNRKKTDRAILQLVQNFVSVSHLLKKLYNDDYEIYKLVEDVLEDSGISIDEGRLWHVDYSVENLNDLLDVLKSHDDDVKPKVEIETLEDLGFRSFADFGGRYLYEKVVEDSYDAEVSEEVVEVKDGVLWHRQRTTVWKPYDRNSGGRESDKILYKRLRMTKKLEKAYWNSKKNKLKAK